MNERKQPNPPTDIAAAGTGAGRMNTRAVLRDTIKRKRREIESLEILDKAINWDLLHQQEEELLWELFIKIPR